MSKNLIIAESSEIIRKGLVQVIDSAKEVEVAIVVDLVVVVAFLR